jgi:hypothetical protein
MNRQQTRHGIAAAPRPPAPLRRRAAAAAAAAAGSALAPRPQAAAGPAAACCRRLSRSRTPSCRGRPPLPPRLHPLVERRAPLVRAPPRRRARVDRGAHLHGAAALEAAGRVATRRAGRLHRAALGAAGARRVVAAVVRALRGARAARRRARGGRARAAARAARAARAAARAAPRARGIEAPAAPAAAVRLARVRLRPLPRERGLQGVQPAFVGWGGGGGGARRRSRLALGAVRARRGRLHAARGARRAAAPRPRRAAAAGGAASRRAASAFTAPRGPGARPSAAGGLGRVKGCPRGPHPERRAALGTLSNALAAPRSLTTSWLRPGRARGGATRFLTGRVAPRPPLRGFQSSGLPGVFPQARGHGRGTAVDGRGLVIAHRRILRVMCVGSGEGWGPIERVRRAAARPEGAGARRRATVAVAPRTVAAPRVPARAPAPRPVTRPEGL